jgi:hypothetical protein
MFKLPTSLLGFIFTAAIYASPVSATMIFINEIHYDNDGSDTGEAVEVAGPAGTDLTGWDVIFYNGNGGTVYDTVSLSGSIDDEGGGFGSVSISQSGIQNGDPDGIALVDDGGNVVQFLSYEGSFTATDGPASGMTSTDIGTQETSSTPAGTSLQLVGPGTEYEDFTWYPPLLSAPDAYSDTFGDINTDQTFLSSYPTPTELFISEMVEGSGFNKALELANFTGEAIDLAALDYEVDIYHNGSSTPTYTLDLSGIIADGDVFVLANPDAVALILDVADAIFSDILFNGDDAIVLTKGGSIIDVLGQIGFDPGSQWGSLLVSTQNNTLIRKSTVFGGDTDGSDSFNPYVEWLGFEENYFGGLGSHYIRISQVPEPTTLALFGLGLAGLGFTRRRMKA